MDDAGPWNRWTMRNQDHAEKLADRLVAAQAGLYGYILTLLPRPDQANEVLQETNLVLWREAADFSPEGNFYAWACRVAYFQVLTHRRKKHRNRMVFGDAFLEGLAQQAAPGDDAIEEECVFLHECLKELTAEERELIHKRYDIGQSVKAMAAEREESPNAVAVSLFRIRQSLMKCVESKAARSRRE
jgi:RNA polymerase sigma-70 factor, ECF subfamily